MTENTPPSMFGKALPYLIAIIIVVHPLLSVSQISLASNIEISYTNDIIKEAKTLTEWADDIRLTFCTRTRYPVIGVVGNLVHVVWEGPRGPAENPWSYEIYYNRSINRGRTWEQGKMLSIGENNTISGAPEIAAGDDNIYIVYENDRNTGIIEVYYVNSTDNGETWSEPRRLSDLNNSDSMDPEIAVDEDNVYVVWEDRRGQRPEVYFKYSNDNGKTWSDDIALTSDDNEDSCSPKIAVNDSNLHVVWNDYRAGGWEAYYKKSTNHGETWSADEPLSKIDGWISFVFGISVDNSNIHVIMDDSTGGSVEIYYRNSTDNGDSWNDEIQITANDGYFSSDPSISVSGPSIYLTWCDERDGSGCEIYYRSSTDGGTQWGSITRLTNATGYSFGPRIVTDGNFTHIVWIDDRTGGTGNSEIYYKRSPPFDEPIITYTHASRTENVSSTRPTTITANATDENLTVSPWNVTVYESDGVTVVEYLTEELSLSSGDGYCNMSVTWTPQIVYTDGYYIIRLFAMDTANNTATEDITVSVYNMKEKITDVLLLDMYDNPVDPTNVVAGNTYQVGASLINLESTDTQTLQIIQVKDTGGKVVYITTASGNLPPGYTFNLTSSWSVPSAIEPGVYATEAFAWNHWVSQGPETWESLAREEVTTIAVVSSGS